MAVHSQAVREELQTIAARRRRWLIESGVTLDVGAVRRILADLAESLPLALRAGQRETARREAATLGALSLHILVGSDVPPDGS